MTSSPPAAAAGPVCVTGGSGFVGSWLLRLLLERGYTVHATVKNLDDERETKHLLELNGAASRLKLFQMDLLDPASVREAVKGTVGVFHLASPLLFTVDDPEKELVEPALKGTLNTLRAAKDYGVGRVVLISSSVAMFPGPSWPADKPLTEECWSEVDHLKNHNKWYPVSKTLAEKAAWEFAGTEGLNLVVLNPGWVVGPVLPPVATFSANCFMILLQGNELLDFEFIYNGCIDVRDVAQSLVTLYENPAAKGRYLCMESVSRWIDFVNLTADICPEYLVKRIEEDKQSWVIRDKDAARKLINLGVRFTPLEKTIKDMFDSLKSKGFIN